jgi:chemotaxis-related protein WspB
MLYLIFSLGADRYALSTMDVLAVRPVPTVKTLPSTPPWVAGLASDAQGTFPVIDLCALAVNRPARAVMSTRMALLRYTEGMTSTAPEPRLGVIIEQATSTLAADESDFVDPGLTTPEAPYLGPVLQHKDGRVIQRVLVRDLLPGWVRERLFSE